MPPKTAYLRNPEKKFPKSNKNISNDKTKVKTTKPTHNNVSLDETETKAHKEKVSITSTKSSVATPKRNSVEGPKFNILARLATNATLEKAIAEIDLKGSSSSESEESTVEIYGAEVESSVSDVSDKQMPDILNVTSQLLAFAVTSEEESEEEPEYLRQQELIDDENFFEAFGDVPEVDELSMDSSEDLITKEQPVVKKPLSQRSVDAGKFVNPITGKSPSTSSQSSSIEEIAEEKQSVVIVEENGSSRSSEQDVKPIETIPTKERTEPLDSFDDNEETLKEEEDQDDFLQFLELRKQREAAETDDNLAIDVEALLREQMERLNYEQTMEFINNLIDKCVEKAEYVDENVILRKNLDKNKIICELKTKLAALQFEKKSMHFLNRKCVEHFRRKCSFRQLNDDSTKANQNNYYNILQNLDNLLVKEKELKEQCSIRIEESKEEFEIAHKKTQQKVEQLEHLIKSTFQKEKFDKLKESVSRDLGNMSSIRKEVSAIRFKLFTEQHDISKLKEKLRVLEDLGNGLRVKDYENLETETTALGKKLEERNNTVKKLRFQSDSDIHSSAHVKEKIRTLRHMISVQKEVLNELQDEKIRLRKYVTELKAKHNRNRYDIHQLSFQCGLLDKPILMTDYDQTVETLNKLKISNEDLKKKTDGLTKRIAVLEDMSFRKIHSNSSKYPQNI